MNACRGAEQQRIDCQRETEERVWCSQTQRGRARHACNSRGRGSIFSVVFRVPAMAMLDAWLERHTRGSVTALEMGADRLWGLRARLISLGGARRDGRYRANTVVAAAATGCGYWAIVPPLVGMRKIRNEVWREVRQSISCAARSGRGAGAY